MTQYLSRGEAETEKLALHLAAVLHAGDVLLLRGPMGAGKTAFVRGLAAGLGVNRDAVSSPTFVLQHIYEGDGVPLVHMDLYRLANADLFELGFDDMRESSVTAIEWPDKVMGDIAPPYVEVDIVPDEYGVRAISLRAVGRVARLMRDRLDATAAAP